MMYVPRQGATGQRTSCKNPQMVQRCLKELQPLMEGRLPTAKVVRAMQAKIDGEEVLRTYITEAHASASGGELDLDAALAGTTVGDVKACLSDAHEMPVYLQRLFSGAMEVSECRLLAELVASGCESLLLVLNLDLPRFRGSGIGHEMISH